jgi:hypothetical protein
MASDNHKIWEVRYLDEKDQWISVWPKHVSFLAAVGTASRVRDSRFFAARGYAADRLIRIGDPPPQPKAVRIVDLRNSKVLREWKDD